MDGGREGNQARRVEKKRWVSFGLRAVVCGLLPVLLLAGAVSAADVVRTADGQEYSGAIRFEAGRLVVKPAQGRDVVLEFAKVREILNPADAPPPADAGPPNDEADEPPSDEAGGKLTGLKAEYFADAQMKQPLLVRLERLPRFGDGGAMTPHPRVARQFTARWTGQIEPPAAMNGEIPVQTNGAVRIWIDGKLVADHPENDAGTFTFPIKLAGNRRYDFRCEYSYSGPKARAELRIDTSAKAHSKSLRDWVTPPADAIPPVISIVSPQRGQIFSDPKRVLFEVAGEAAPGRTIKQVRFYTDDHLAHGHESAPWKWTWEKPVPGYHTMWVEAVDDQGMVSRVRSSHFVAGGNAGGTLPEGWAEMPIGVNAWTGSARWADGQFSLSAQDGDIFGTKSRSSSPPDVLHYVFRPMTGDATFIARLASVGPDAPTTAGGIFLRPTLELKSDTIIFLGQTAALTIEMRREKGSGRRNTKELKTSAPCWLKLTRHGNTIRTYYSSDGRDWQSVSTSRIDLPQTVWIGMALAGSREKKAQAVFSDVSLTPGAPEMEAVVAGVALRDGSMLTGEIRSADGESIGLFRGGDSILVPREKAARLVFVPMPAEVAAVLRPGRTGALMANGDFIEGNVSSMSKGIVMVESVLFGQQKLKAGPQAVAVVLRDVQPVERKYEIVIADGSLLRSDKAAITGDRLKVEDVGGMSFELTSADIRELRSAP